MTQVTERQARDMYAVANSRNVDTIVEQYADDAIFQVPGQVKPLTGKEAIRGFFKENYTAFPDWTMTAKTVAVSGNDVLIVDSVSGTQTGPIVGWDGKSIAPTNRKVVLEGMTHIVLNDGGKIKSLRVYGNPLAISHQLGIAPPTQ